MKQYYQYYHEKINKLEHEHKSEISRLRDQIYILQNAFHQYISFNSIDTHYKNRAIKRHVPFTTFFNTENHDLINHTFSHLMGMFSEMGFSFYNPDKPAEKFNQRMAVSIEDINLIDLNSKIETFYHAFCGELPNTAIGNKANEFYQIIDHMPSFTMKVGAFIIAKTLCNDGSSKINHSQLSIAALIHIDRNPNLLQNPDRIIKELNTFCYF